MKASELVEEILRLIEKHGDQEVYSGGEDYPGEVTAVGFQKDERNPYVPRNSFKIYGGI
jgi:hypothetical protein